MPRSRRVYKKKKTPNRWLPKSSEQPSTPNWSAFPKPAESEPMITTSEKKLLENITTCANETKPPVEPMYKVSGFGASIAIREQYSNNIDFSDFHKSYQLNLRLSTIERETAHTSEDVHIICRILTKYDECKEMMARMHNRAMHAGNGNTGRADGRDPNPPAKQGQKADVIKKKVATC
ncbi:hypothetical protein GE061_015830 [Apolygus lucorum]|uniref:Uncharacterized protein n=1 Tax=Apolygus lucorum TaxID=248454 RepID=A0A8S9XN92_APOLU|nr:hypothetical protein GE061_015830 [Apolygus lucorum]